ncbi:AP-3 complex subunit beta-1-like [Rhopilema esculentum]|uniref:AP-3 complex subunit beta-1-like n=1 Tax=Rhopilema esculentum TaxID=499914 RepID=UPI0031D544E7|eukprot:gene5972-11333_t
MASNVSYNQEKPQSKVFEEEPEATGVAAFLASHFKKHDDLREMLDNSKDGPKLDAMRRIIGMMAQGKDVSELFPAVVKNVVSKNIEVKKLVYVYLVRYAEEQQDLALLSISTFQRALKDPNQLIRASALRVLSSIRVPVICPIMMICLKEASMDMSPYVRKTAANAIAKLYSLDPDQKDALVEIIEKLLQDKTTLVAGSVVYAFEEVCPDRIDLVHKNFRKLCNMLIDIDEWGQVAVINMLTRYARTQFLDPNKNEDNLKEEQFYPSSEESEDNGVEEEKETTEKKQAYVMDSDHRLLLRSAKPLLQSRNASVVMAVVKLYYYCAPSSEVHIVVRAMIRLLRSHREVQTVILSNIATMSVTRKVLFQQYLKSFFVHSDDSTNVRVLKLEILTNLATESNISVILREFQTYVTSSDKEFAVSTVQAIGRCASNIPEVTDTCLAGLVRLLSNRDESVVGESVVVIKKLLQKEAKEHTDIIVHMAKIIDKISISMARASILWLIGEYSDHVPKIAPDVLRKMAKNFINEEDIVKLQIVTLGAKLFLTNPKQTKLLCQYVLQLAKYDQNYDIRDRARFIKVLLFPGENTEGGLKKKAKKFFLSEKPAPVIESIFKDRGQYQLSSLSHMINARANGYQDLPDFPATQPDPTVRNVEVVDKVWGNQLLVTKSKKKSSFYSDSEGEEEESDEESEEESGSEESEEDEENSEEEATDEDVDSEASEEEDSEEEDDAKTAKAGKKVSKAAAVESSEEEDEESEEESSDESESEEETSEEEEVQTKKTKPKETKKKSDGKDFTRNKSSYDQLLDIDSIGDQLPAIDSTSTDMLTPSLSSEMEALSLTSSNAYSINPQTTDVQKTYELLNRIAGEGLSIEYRFTRAPCIYSNSMVTIELILKNTSAKPIQKISVGSKRLSAGLQMHDFQEIDVLNTSQTLAVSIGIDFRDTTQPANFDICTNTRKFAVTVKPPVGELVQRNPISQDEFISEKAKLTGMTESCISTVVADGLKDAKALISKITQNINTALVPSTEDLVYRFAAKLISSSTLVLLTIQLSGEDNTAKIIVNCEKISITSLLSKEVSNMIS